VEVRAVVECNDKQRFAMSTCGETGVLLIRANQGHTISVGLDDALLLEPLTEATAPPEAVHGTYTSAWASIKTSGLHRMSRNHVHLAKALPSAPGGVISGMRASCHVAVWVDVPAAIRAGVPFYRSQNGVVLTPGEGETGALPPRFFTRAVDLATGREIELGSGG